MSLHNWSSVVDRVRALGLEVHKSLTWPAGDAVRDEWGRRHGRLPEKALRRKASGTGSHCFAIYPPEFRDEMDRIIREVSDEVESEAAKQFDLFQRGKRHE